MAAAVFLVGGGIFLFWFLSPKPNSATPRPTPVPVTTIEAERTEFPVYLDALGTVQPLNTVAVRSRVDGPIVNVAFKEGQMVKAGDLLVQIDPRPFQAALNQATAKKAQDEANLQNAMLDLERYSKLADEGNAPRQQRDTQAAQVQQMKALVQGDAAAEESARLQVEYASIRAPISGRASFIQATLGNIVHAADTAPIVTIAQTQPISVVFTATEERLPDIVQALNTRQVEAIALSSDGQKTLAHGVLTVVNNTIDTTSGTVQLKASFDNNDNVLWPGLSVTLRLHVDTLNDAIVIPDSAVERGPDGFFVYVIDDQNKAQHRTIKVGPMTDGRAVVTQGVAAGDRVVTEGQYRVDNGTLVAATDQTPPAVHAANAKPVEKASANGKSPTAKD